MVRRALSLIAVNLIVFVVLAEVAGLAYYYWDTGRFFYTSTRNYRPIPETARGELTGDALHPYFGPMHRPGVRAESNNFGFGSPYAFPYRRANDRQLLIGIFGGSVARFFCDQGIPRLTQALERDPRYAGREIVPLCFAHEGYKQPQQLLVLAYFLSIGQELDLVLNIDGFNEVALGAYNYNQGRDISMPSPLHLDPLINLIDRSTMTPAMLESLTAIERSKRRINELSERLNQTRLASVHFVRERLYLSAWRRYEEELARLASLPSNPSDSSLILVTPAVKPRDERDLYDDIASGWADASLLMQQMLAARGVPYVHVLQPNQYFTSRRFSEEEARVALNDDTPFKRSVELGYPVLQRTAPTLRERERFLDATTVFDNEPAAVYQDDCCHYTQRGNDLLAEAIARYILTDSQSSR